ncbi:hypothetical protein JCM8097_006296 [Rhodosporidiobolus ruineniae]
MRPTLPRRMLDRTNTCGFIGLGAMGRVMSANLLNKTFAGSQGVYATGVSMKDTASKPAFVVFDAFPKALNEFLTTHTRAYAGRDVLPASSPAGVVKLASTVVTMLPSSKEVEEVYLGESSLAEGLESLSDERRAETLLIDCTTGDREVARRVSEEVRRRYGVRMVDAPVSGGTVGAEKGTLSFMVGGEEESFNKAQPYLAKMGARYIYCGESGNGLAAKICNNLLLGISMVGTAEAMLLGQSLGLSPALLASILNTSTGRCWSSEVNNPAPGATPQVPTPADRGYTGGFLSKLMAKDLNLALSAATSPSAGPSPSSSVPLPLGQLTTTLYNKLSAHDEFGGRDFSVVFEYLKTAMEGQGAAKEEKEGKRATDGDGEKK